MTARPVSWARRLVEFGDVRCRRHEGDIQGCSLIHWKPDAGSRLMLEGQPGDIDQRGGCAGGSKALGEVLVSAAHSGVDSGVKEWECLGVRNAGHEPPGRLTKSGSYRRPTLFWSTWTSVHRDRLARCRGWPPHRYRVSCQDSDRRFSGVPTCSTYIHTGNSLSLADRAPPLTYDHS